ncbi:uncharacterized protein LOC126744197 [Anthonomus grandis grandis]|uniref:uncharacterized protein LOC126744197 n=1 Tax=Anthonomus grandis grandis TaxID=2921223 RepID=UPI0021665F0A|nr:uncharacterized protein LOC126744197 [Anthonomus grandis grandis]
MEETTSFVAQPFPGSRSLIEQSIRRTGVTGETIQIMISSISKGTIKQYTSTLRCWWQFCINNKIDVFHLSIDLTLKFLTELYNSGVAYGSLNCARSALALIISPEIGSNGGIKIFFKVIGNLRPSKPRYDFTWDPSIVLNFLKELYPLENLSLTELTCKLVTLLALITAHRVKTLALIKLENIFRDETGFEIWITGRTKTSNKTKIQPVLHVPYFAEDEKVCAAKTLEAYLNKTNRLRNKISNLLITTKKPYKPATSQTISRWIKYTLEQSGLDNEIFETAHSTRHSSTSLANKKGINIDLIKSTAAPSNGPSTNMLLGQSCDPLEAPTAAPLPNVSLTASLVMAASTEIGEYKVNTGDVTVKQSFVNFNRASRVLLSTAVVDVIDKHGNTHLCRVLLDSGSESSFITAELCNKLGLVTKQTNISVSGIGQTNSKILKQTSVTIQARQRLLSLSLSIFCGGLNKSTEIRAISW